jgi:hypothetical protein
MGLAPFVSFAHLLRTGREIAQTLAAMEAPDPSVERFLVQYSRLLRRACALEIPEAKPIVELFTECSRKELVRSEDY